MISHIVAAVTSNCATFAFFVGLLVAAVKIARFRGRRTSAAVSGVLLNMFVFWAIGIAQAFTFVARVFGDIAANRTPPGGSLLSLDSAYTSLGFAVMAFVLYGRRAPFIGKVAITTAAAIYGYGAVGGQFFETLVNHAVHIPGQQPVLSEIVVNAVGLGLLIWHAVVRITQPSTTDAPALAGFRSTYIPPTRMGALDQWS
jgi:hypothetical protein